MKVSTELVRKVYDDDNGACIQVGPDGDGLDLVEISTRDPHSRTYFGDFRVVLQPVFARALAEAILAAAAESEARNP